MAVRMDNGKEVEYGPVDGFYMPPVVGNQRCVLIDFTGVANYAQPAKK
ncbi:MAG: hypothetical protein WAV38_10150 [Xanthobacteraceae bacterium]|jgi:hypothetical protein